MNRGFVPIALAALVAAFLWLEGFAGPSARAHRMQCGTRAVLTKLLAARFGEAPVFRGVRNGRLIELFWSRDQTFTVVVSSGEGVACIVASGENGQFLPRSFRKHRQGAAKRFAL